MFKIVLFLFIIHLAFASDVLEFQDSNFDLKVAEHSIILVEFYAPWCGHCKRLAPEYEEAATKLKKADTPISLAKVDCTAETKVCEKYGVSGYPTLKVFKNGEFAYEYGGDRSGDGIVKYMIGKSGPVSRELFSIEEYNKVISSDSSVVFGFLEKKDSALHFIFNSVADKLNEDIKFVHTLSADIANSIGIDEGIYIIYPKIMASKFEDAINRYEGSQSELDLSTWIEKNIMGIAGIRTSSNTKYFNERPIIIAYYNADYEKNPKGSNYWRNRILKVGMKYIEPHKRIHFAISNSMQLSQELAEFGIENPDSSKLYITARNAKNQKFKMDKDFSMDNLDAFIEEFLEEKLTAYLKSESIPEKNDEPVKVVVAKTFDEIVNDPTKDVLIEFYAPWCGHCKSLAPKYDDLAKALSKETDIVIAKMDATANDVPPGYEVTGFPTIYFAPKNEKSSPKPYSGEREVDGFIKYIASEATSPLKGFDRHGKIVRSDL